MYSAFKLSSSSSLMSSQLILSIPAGHVSLLPPKPFAPSSLYTWHLLLSNLAFESHSLFSSPFHRPIGT